MFFVNGLSGENEGNGSLALFTLKGKAFLEAGTEVKNKMGLIVNTKCYITLIQQALTGFPVTEHRKGLQGLSVTGVAWVFQWQVKETWPIIGDS